jgi:hypothetical protein
MHSRPLYYASHQSPTPLQPRKPSQLFTRSSLAAAPRKPPAVVQSNCTPEGDRAASVVRQRPARARLTSTLPCPDTLTWPVAHEAGRACRPTRRDNLMPAPPCTAADDTEETAELTTLVSHKRIASASRASSTRAPALDTTPVSTRRHPSCPRWRERQGSKCVLLALREKQN